MQVIFKDILDFYIDIKEFYPYNLNKGVIMKYEIGKRIRYFRGKKGLSQKELAEALGISSGKLSNWEKGINRPPADFLSNICISLNITADELLGIPPKGKGKLLLNNREMSHINKYRKLKETRQNRVDKITDMELDEQRQEELKSSSGSFLKG